MSRACLQQPGGEVSWHMEPGACESQDTCCAGTRQSPGGHQEQERLLPVWQWHSTGPSPSWSVQGPQSALGWHRCLFGALSGHEGGQWREALRGSLGVQSLEHALEANSQHPQSRLNLKANSPFLNGSGPVGLLDPEWRRGLGVLS